MRDGRSDARDPGSPLRGLTVSIDRFHIRHVYRVAPEAQRGIDFNEIGALRTESASDRIPAWLEHGRLLGGPLEAVEASPSAKQVLRWILAPLAWATVASRPKRVWLVASRTGTAMLRPWRRHTPRARRRHPPAGYLHRTARPGTLPLFSAVHQITGDQLVTTVPPEAAELGYGPPVLVGHLVAAAPATGVLVRRSGVTPVWASRLGLQHSAELVGTGGLLRPSDDAPTVETIFRVAGWAMLAGEGVSRVECFVNSRLAGRARLGLPRPAPQRLWRSPEAFISGFDFWVGESALDPDASDIEVEALVTGVEGTEFVVTARAPFTRTVDSAPVHEASGRDPAPPPQRRPRPARAPGEELCVLAFTHRLDAGGAQRYFCEQVRRLAARSNVSPVVVASVDGEWRPYLEAARVEVRLTPPHPTGSMDEYEEGMRALTAVVGDQRFDAVFVNTLDCFPGADLADRLGLPTAWAIHESFEPPVWWSMASREEPPPYPQARLEHALGRADALLFVAEATKALYRSYAREERMLVTPYGLEIEEIDAFRRGCDRTSLRRRLGVPEDASVVLCLSVIEPRKGQAALARAFAEISASHPSAHLLLVGETDSPYCRALRRYVDASHIADRCTIEPLTMDAYSRHAVADVFALASNVESLPIAILEAMSFETPVVAPRIFGVPELITDGRDGYLFEESDVADLARTLDRALGADPAERRAVGLAGSDRVRHRNDAERYSASLARLLRRLAEDPTRAPSWDQGTTDPSYSVTK